MSNREMEDFKRPNHPDFQTSSELRDQKFNGMRHNSLYDSQEVWIEGEVVASASREDMLADRDILNKRYAKYFGLHNVDLPFKRRETK